MTRALPMPAQLPPDIKLMNMVTLLCGLAFLAMALAVLVSWLMRQSLFNLSAITVQGDVTHNNTVTLRANVAPRLAGNFFTVDLAQTRAVFESTPWVRQATVQRQFPDRLKVVLQEHRAEAIWGFDGDTRLLNSFGEVFEANQDEVEAAGLPQLNGSLGQAPLVLQGYRILAPQFQKLDVVLERLELTGQGSWRASLDSGAELELGQGSVEEIDSRTQRFITTLTQVSSRYGRDLESADLRYSNGYAIKLRGVTTISADKSEDKKVKR
jgi:cell division protein FtsQ